MTKPTQSERFPWAILIGGLLFQGAYTGILINSTGLVISATILDMGFSAGALSPYYTIKMLAGAATIPIMTSLFYRWGAKRFLGLMAAASCIAFGVMALFTQPWQWYADAVVMGVFGGISGMVIPCIINNWFKKYNGVITGAVMASSGLMGAAFNPICSRWISSCGWQGTSVILALLVGGLCLFAALFLLHLRPSDCNRTAFGECVQGQKKAVQSGFAGDRQVLMVVLCVGVLLTGSIMVQMINYIPLYAASIGFDLNVGALMTSFIMVGNVAGKLLAGVISDRIGPWKTGICIFAAVGVGMAVLMTEPGQPVYLYGASVLYGFAYSISTVLPALVCLDAFGSEHYAKKLSRIVAINNLLGALCNFLMAAIYDNTASFRLVFCMGIALCCCSAMFALTILAIRAKALQIKTFV